MSVRIQPRMDSLPSMEAPTRPSLRELEQMPEIQDVLRQIPNAKPGLANIVFDMFCLAAQIGLQVSRNERNQADTTKRTYRRDSELQAGFMRSGATATVASAFLTAVGQFGASMGSNDADKLFFGEVAKQIPQFLNPWTGSYQTRAEEARSRKELSYSDLNTGSQASGQFEQKVMDIAKNLFEQTNRLNPEAARNS